MTLLTFISLIQSAALTLSPPAQSVLGPTDAPLLAQAPGASDDDEDEAPTPPVAPSPQKQPAAGAPAQVQPSVVPAPTPEPQRPDAQRLVSGAPLFNPNVAVHIVEKKKFADRGKREIILFPIAAQANGKFTQHYGSGLAAMYHLQENFGLHVTGIYNWYASESGFNNELIDKVKQEAQSATSLLLQWGVQAGVEVTPLYGKFAWYESSLAHFSFVLNGGAGLGSTRHQIKPPTASSEGTAGDTGLKFLGGLGGGFRLQLGNRFAVRIELRDLVYTARVDSVNGCNFTDLTAMNTAAKSNRSVTSANVGSGCRASTFDGVQKGTNTPLSDTLPLAIKLVKDASSDVLNNVGVYAGLSFLF